jgi:hypothetical protein
MLSDVRACEKAVGATMNCESICVKKHITIYRFILYGTLRGQYQIYGRPTNTPVCGGSTGKSVVFDARG